jgi:hypothetical protein
MQILIGFALACVVIALGVLRALDEIDREEREKKK